MEIIKKDIRMKWFLCIAFCMIFVGSHAQNRIEGEITAASEDQLILAELFGDKINIVDTIPLDTNNRFLYHMHPKNSKGMYRLFISENIWLDFILGWDNLDFQTIAKAPIEALVIKKSWQNKTLYDFYKLLDDQNKKIEALRNFIINYPETDRLMQLSKNKAKDLYQERQDFLNDLEKNHNNAFVTRYLTFLYQMPLDIFYSNSPEIKHEMISNRDWSDTLLLHSDAYSTSIIDYLMLFGDRNARRDQQIKLYKQAIDSIFNFIPEKNPVYDYTLMYLMQGFEQFEMEPLVVYLVTNYADNCKKTEGNLENRIEYYKKFQTGNTVQNFISSKIDGEPVNLYDEVTGKTLLVFWATWCGHCKQMNKALRELYPQLLEKNIEIVSVSLDNKPEELESYLQDAELPFDVWCDYQGWESPVVEAFHLYATPTMLLIDENFKILGKPLNINQLSYIITDIK